MRRREFITLLGGTATAWPLAARALQSDRVRRVAVLMGYSEADPEAKALLAEFTEGLSELGWIEGRSRSIGAGGWLSWLSAPCPSRRPGQGNSPVRTS